MRSRISTARTDLLVTVDLSVANHVAQVTLNRPEALNSLDSQMRAEWTAVWAEIRSDPDIWVVVMTGAGDRAFCVGSDLKDQSGGDVSYVSQAFGGDGRGDGHLVVPMETDKPIVCAVNGHALGGGLEIALATDIRIASSNATFGLPEVRVGSMPGAGGTQNLPRAVASSDAMYLLLTGERVAAGRALQMGLISECLEDREALLFRAHEIASLIAANAPLSVRATKRLAQASRDWPLSRGLESERHVWGLLKATADRAEGRAAFSERREPHYRGV